MRGKRFDPIPPPFPYPGKGGGSGGYIPRRALGGSTAGTASQGCGAPPRSGGFALDRQPRLCYGWRGDGGYIQQSLRGRSGENGRVPSGHGVQKIYKNTAPIFVGSDVLRKVDSPLPPPLRWTATATSPSVWLRTAPPGWRVSSGTFWACKGKT